MPGQKERKEKSPAGHGNNRRTTTARSHNCNKLNSTALHSRDDPGQVPHGRREGLLYSLDADLHLSQNPQERRPQALFGCLMVK